jgi:UDP-N-acetylmuramate--alanine ligase
VSARDGPWRGRRLHLVGVGGAGMSGYARAAAALGAEVSGSDAVATPYLRRLGADGILDASVGHAPENVPAGEDVEVVYSAAVPPDNVERLAARQRGLAERPRAELLAELSALRRTIAIAGTHGKTTTASMLVHALRGAGIEPGWLIGAPPGGGLPNARWSAGEWLVVEADESDRSMLSLSVAIALLTNVELDHHATFSSLAQLREAFGSFLALAREAVVVWDRPELLALSSAIQAATLVAYEAPSPRLGPAGSRFEWRGEEVRLSVPGAHNALDAVAALEGARLAGADAAVAAAALAGFRGAGRRFELVGRTPLGARVFDDYAHHPSEVAATLAAARTLGDERLVAVFQPHLYSRTRLLARELGAALAEADVIVVTDVYPARERAEDNPGVSGLAVAEAAADCARGRPVFWLPTLADARGPLQRLLGEGDLCVVMGAGDVDELARRLVG